MSPTCSGPACATTYLVIVGHATIMLQVLAQIERDLVVQCGGWLLELTRCNMLAREGC